jgi:hypothetical protein
VQWHDVLRLGVGVTFLAFLAGVYLHAWTSLPLYFTLIASAALLGGWVIRRDRRVLRRTRELRIELDSAQLAVEQDGEKRTIATKDSVRRVTHDADGIVAIYANATEPIFRIRTTDLESGELFWQELQKWGLVEEVPTGRFSPAESIGALLGVVICLGWVLYVPEPVFVVAFGLITAVMLVATMRLPWRHRSHAPAARRIVVAGSVLGAILAVRIFLAALSG